MNALKMLSDMDYAYKLDQYQHVPESAIVRIKFSDRTANQLQQCILTWLRLHGNYATRINVTGRQLPSRTIIDVIGRAHVTPGKWLPSTTRKGTSDIHAVVGGRHCSIEVKIGRDRMSEDQIKTKYDVERSGGLFYVAKDFESFVQWYNDIMSNLDHLQ